MNQNIRTVPELSPSFVLVKEIAGYFRRSPVAIGEGIRKVEGLLRKNTSLEEALKRMGENVVKGKKRKYRASVA